MTGSQIPAPSLAPHPYLQSSTSIANKLLSPSLTLSMRTPFAHPSTIMSAPEKKGSDQKSGASNGRWQFIDATNNSRSNLTQVKRHVMQEYMRNKKGERQSDSDEENRIQPKRGRPRKPRAATRKSTRKTKDTEGPSQSSPPKNDSTTAPAEASFSTDDQEADRWLLDDSITSDPSLFQFHDETLFSPYHIQAPGHSYSPYDLTDPSLQPQGFAPGWNSVPMWSSSPTSSLQLAQSPRTPMSAARTDPFNSLPIQLDLEGQKLFDFYVNDMPACSYGSQYRSSKAHNWYTTIFVPEAMKGAVAFQNTILVHAANTWAWVRNETETSNTLVHRDRALSMLRDHLTKNPHDISDVAIISCLSAAALEDFDPRPGHKEISWVHMRAAREMIRARGGPAAFANTRLGMLINWQDYILSGYETHGPSFFFERDPPIKTVSSEPPPSQPSNISAIPSPPSSPSSSLSDQSIFPKRTMTLATRQKPCPMDEFRLQCEEFLDFLRRCEQLALYQKDNPKSCDLSRYTTISEDSILFRILAAPPGLRFTASGDRKQMVTRLTALMMLNAALWDYRYTPVQGATFLKTLEKSVIDSEVSMNGSVEAILQILLACNDGTVNTWATGAEGTISPVLSEVVPDFTQYSPTATSPSARPWFAGRMLKVAKRLGSESWYRVNDFLFSCLTLQVSESTVYSWEGDLRREILDAPLTSYVMPALTS